MLGFGALAPFAHPTFTHPTVSTRPFAGPLDFPGLFGASPFSPVSFSPLGAPASPLWPTATGAAGSELSPAVDVKDTKDSLVFHVELPGANLDDLHVDLKGNALVISGKKEKVKHEEHESYVHEERRSGSFTRYFSLPPGVTSEDISANFNNGILTVGVKKPAAADATRSKIDVASPATAPAPAQ